MTFLAPFFLLGLAGLAIPVVIHLTQREKKQVVHFPSLMFIRRIPYQSVRRRAIRHWLLLCLRLAALALIVLAFARPLLTTSELGAAAGAGAREVVILLDQSYSMGFGGRWAEAQAAARTVVDGLQPFDRVSLVMFDETAEIALRSAGDQDRLRAAIDTAQPNDHATSFAPALKVAGSILVESALPRREVVVVSDFQRGGWRGEEGAEIPPGTAVIPSAVTGDASDPNLTIAAISLARTTQAGQERVTVTANVVNRSAVDVTTQSLTLELGDRAIETEQVDVVAGGITPITFQPFTLTPGVAQQGAARLSDDALAADNMFRFVVQPIEPVRVLLVQRPWAGASGFYLEQALAIGEAPRFETVTRSADTVSDTDLADADVVLVHDVAVGDNLARRLQRHVEDGGGLLLAAGPRSTWPADVALLPGVLGGAVDRTRGTAGRVGALEFEHPVFEVFRAPRSGDFTSVQMYGYRTLEPVPNAQVLAQFDSGTPALLEQQVGEGRVLLWGSSMDITWSDFPQRPVFLPFVHRALRHLASYVEAGAWLTVGDAFDAGTIPGLDLDDTYVVVTPGGQRLPLDEEGGTVLSLDEQGFYEVRTDSEADDANAVFVASNVDPFESDLSPLNPEDLAVAAMADVAPGEAEVDAVLTAEAQEQRQRLWWFLLVAGLLMLGAESILANRLSQA